MAITANTTLHELQLTLAKLGIDSLVWSSLSNIYAITVVGDDGREVATGRDLIEVIGRAIDGYAHKVGTKILFENRERIKTMSHDELARAATATRKPEGEE